MRFLKYFLITICSLVVLIILIFLYFNHNPKPDKIELTRIDIPEDEIEEMATSLVHEMTLEEKVAMMTPNLKSNAHWFAEMIGDGMKYNHEAYVAGGNKRLNIPAIRFHDGPRGVVSGTSTCFPVAIQRAASWDRTLEKRIGEAIGKEIRAHGGNYFGGVCINLLRHPAGGRAQEGYGEDSYLTGQMGASLLKGVQLHNVMACVKHYAMNNQENTRFEINVEADERVLREVYLPHFKECIDQGAASVMGAYNLFRGQQACESEYLLTHILRDNWGFKGFTISDFLWGIHNTELAANAGLDVEMPATQDYGNKLIDAVKKGNVSEANITLSANRIVRTILKFETSPDPVSEYPFSLIGSDEHISLALEAAEKSIVLMKNNQNVLPLDKLTVKNVLVLGKLAQAENLGDHGSSWVRPEYVITPLKGLKNQYGDQINFIFDEGRNLIKTKTLAEGADAVIFVVGNNHDDEGEYIQSIGGDRENLHLHEEESILIKEIAPLNDKSIVVLIGGSAILSEEWDQTVASMVHAFYPGMEGGTAIAKVLFGDVNPGGKLPFTVPKSRDDLPSFDRFAKEVTYDRYHGYIKLDKDQKEAAYPFGHGLSYTTFSMDSMTVVNDNKNLNASVNVTNTGDLSGDQVIQLYIGFHNSKQEREKKLLKGFKRVTLAPNESKRVTILCPLEKIKYYNPVSQLWELEKIEYQVFIGSSSNEDDLLISSFSLQ